MNVKLFIFSKVERDVFKKCKKSLTIHLCELEEYRAHQIFMSIEALNQRLEILIT